MTKGSGRATRSRAAEMFREKQRRRRRVNIIVAGVSIAVIGSAIAFASVRAADNPGEYVVNMGNIHIENGSPFDNYNTTPPTSGPHWGNLAPWGISAQPIPDELQVHNLEDGGVGIQYNCPDGCPQLVAQLEPIVRQFPEGVFMAPYPDMEHLLVLTAWNNIDTLDSFDRGRIMRFIRAYQGLDHHSRY